MSQVHENLNRALRRDSLREEKFYFRVGKETHLMSINEIINGNSNFSGLVPLIQRYLNDQKPIEDQTRAMIDEYLSFIAKRAAGILPTDASWMRQFVMSHPDYKHDSIVSDQIQYDLLWKIAQMANEHQS